MIARWRKARERRADDLCVVVEALLAHLGPMPLADLWRYTRGGTGQVVVALLRLEGCGRIERLQNASGRWVYRVSP